MRLFGVETVEKVWKVHLKTVIKKCNGIFTSIMLLCNKYVGNFPTNVGKNDLTAELIRL